MSSKNPKKFRKTSIYPKCLPTLPLLPLKLVVHDYKQMNKKKNDRKFEV